MAVYVIVNLQVRDAVAFEEYRAKVPAFIHKHGGEYLVRGGANEVIEGDWRPQRIVLLRFPDRAAVRAFFDDPEYQPVLRLRQRVADTDIVMVDGI